MSYRDETQSLEIPIDNILEGIKKFDDAVDNRIESNEWTKEHLEGITKLSLELRKIKIKLIKVRKENW